MCWQIRARSKAEPLWHHLRSNKPVRRTFSLSSWSLSSWSLSSWSPSSCDFTASPLHFPSTVALWCRHGEIIHCFENGFETRSDSASQPSSQMNSLHLMLYETTRSIDDIFWYRGNDTVVRIYHLRHRAFSWSSTRRIFHGWIRRW